MRHERVCDSRAPDSRSSSGSAPDCAGAMLAAAAVPRRAARADSAAASVGCRSPRPEPPHGRLDSAGNGPHSRRRSGERPAPGERNRIDENCFKYRYKVPNHDHVPNFDHPA